MNQTISIKRRKSKKIYIKNIPIGGDAPISVQSMTNTCTTNVKATIKQINKLQQAGAEIIRVSVPTLEAAEAFKKIKQKVTAPIVADIHFDYRIALKSAEYGADCLRINPGNIGNLKRIQSVIHIAKEKKIPIRIGVNSGSLEKDIQEKYGIKNPHALFESAMRHVNILEKLDFNNFKVSVKSSDVLTCISAYQLLASAIEQPLHLGITESGSLTNGTVKSAIGIGLLLFSGIGDTLRVSLAADPVNEIKVGFHILQALNIRKRGINFIACPTCSRQEFDVIKVINTLESRLEDITTPMDVSIIGCMVNGIGEAEKSDIGISGYRNKSILYENGVRKKTKIKNSKIIDTIEKYVRKKSKNL
ncbi:1-hydroxy-2-methyl-2-(E)-butenyl 4-diphosphate synthase [Wigglesworthia glossinidia endosymbiont of Glossina morsitans morsitans (Yale colony)]|uniref:4-hydroxy-3-methylbut-2-en-1-yl diphosphate synthase (flavodoxin) n=1 Tax=Wigglesworthia glossinidia endosymbiont of Glossina morsitans morsitans (Yale colony) TaxID=1142511 RepID=H6Q4G3_WIGGL|nr:flavodoxin-dependent (E)-4-hydroxy-3-methylbut-2-enyl-diphosphate synthase [Wigglesworthia glossinidia]AFA41023.1 1-hydroxy-2-methyl-2-(E)-butenyl 4-diphosphate synthase [Wigglesworthia glossinidia endosymbiont of Glossina morsitans morsitans (Yale colony)]